MALPDINTVLGWRGRTIVDESGEKIGTFEEIYLDTQTEKPEWAAVKSGLFGRRHALIPLSEAQEHDDETLRVPFTKSQIDEAPPVDASGELSQEEEASLYSHYGIPYSQQASQTGLPRDEGGHGDEGQPSDTATAGGQAQQGDTTAAGGEEEGTGTSAGTEGETAGEVVESYDVEPKPRERVRLKKYVVTEEVTKTVPVQREELRVEREPLDTGDDER